MPARIEHARRAFAAKDAAAPKAAHSAESFEKSHHDRGPGEYVGDMVYGALDGIVTTFAVVAGSAGAGLPPGIIVVLGMANLLADGLSMAVGNYLSMKSSQSFYAAERKREEWEVEKFPDGEREEVKRIYRSKGFSGKALEKLVELITSKKTVWVDTMMVEGLGLIPEQKSPVKAGLYTYFAFVAAGFVPLVVFILSVFTGAMPDNLFPAAFALTFLTIFAVGSLRSLVIAKNWLVAGGEMLLIGGLTAVISYGIGSFLGALVLH